MRNLHLCLAQSQLRPHGLTPEWTEGRLKLGHKSAPSAQKQQALWVKQEAIPWVRRGLGISGQQCSCGQEEPGNATCTIPTPPKQLVLDMEGTEMGKSPFLSARETPSSPTASVHRDGTNLSSTHPRGRRLEQQSIWASVLPSWDEAASDWLRQTQRDPMKSATWFPFL